MRLSSCLMVLGVGFSVAAGCDDGENDAQNGKGGAKAGGAGGKGGTGGSSGSSAQGGIAGEIVVIETDGAGVGGSSGAAGGTNPDASSGGTGGGSSDGGPDASCLPCATVLTSGNPAALCEDEAHLLQAIRTCACNVHCTVECKDTCTNFSNPTSSCQQCIGAKCQTQIAACIAGNKADAGASDSGPSEGGAADSG